MKVEHCEICHHFPSRGFDAEMGKCECACHRVADASPALLAACKEVLECAEQLIAEGKKLTNSGSTAAACAVMFRARVRPAIALAENSADRS